MVGRKAKAHASTEIGDGGENGRMTRSQAAPEWTVKESLTLVNEIAAVEVDCPRALSSYQKWKMVVENCKSMGLKRTLNQCKLRWSTMLSDYDKIKKWEMREREWEWGEGGEAEEIELISYWALEREERMELGLPEGFDEELFEAVDKYLILQKKDAETDPESDPQAQADFLLDVITKLGRIIVYDY